MWVSEAFKDEGSPDNYEDPLKVRLEYKKLEPPKLDEEGNNSSEHKNFTFYTHLVTTEKDVIEAYQELFEDLQSYFSAVGEDFDDFLGDTVLRG